MDLPRLRAPSSDLAGSAWVKSVEAPGFRCPALPLIRPGTNKSLWRVARTFREQKSTLEVRPIYHQRDDTGIGHIVASFPALRLEVDLQQRLEERAIKVSWPDLMRDLGQVYSVLIELDGNRYQLRTDLLGTAHQAFAAAGVRPPAPVTFLGPVS